MLANQDPLNVIIHYWYVWAFLILNFIYITFKARIKGKIGEVTTSFILKRLNKSKYRVINNVVLNIGGKTSQIDHVVISNFGVFVIETKNQKGWILGGEHSEYWTQVIYKRKDKFYNPIRQNQGHVFALRHFLQEYPSIRFVPIVVFFTNATIKVKTTSEVVYTNCLLKTIRKFSDVVLSENEKEAIFHRITSVNIKKDYNSSQHVAAIK